MTEDEAAIRELLDTWSAASANWDLDTMLSLLADDVVFLTVGAKPFGKKEFAERGRAMRGMHVESKNDVEEVVVSGDLAYLRNHLKVTINSKDRPPVHREGYTLTVFRREASRRWVLARDANLMAEH
jgi:uncharacterized protein (TIGR02246 family)